MPFHNADDFVGVGLRTKHYPHILENRPNVGWFEIISENFMDAGGRSQDVLRFINQHYPVALHGVSLSIGSTDPLNLSYLKSLKNLIARVQPFLVSDHICWTSALGKNTHDLLPLPFTEEVISHLVPRIQKVQEILGRPLVLENASAYIGFKESQMSESDFLKSLSQEAGISILIDLNNVYVNSKNFDFDPVEYLNNLSSIPVAQFHLAGHSDMGDYLFDTHIGPIPEPVWSLYRKALKIWGPCPTLIEWDAQVPAWDVLMNEVYKAQKLFKENC